MSHLLFNWYLHRPTILIAFAIDLRSPHCFDCSVHCCIISRDAAWTKIDQCIIFGVPYLNLYGCLRYTYFSTLQTNPIDMEMRGFMNDAETVNIPGFWKCFLKSFLFLILVIGLHSLLYSMTNSILVNKRFCMPDTLSTVKRLIKNKFSKYSENVKLWATTTKHPKEKLARKHHMVLASLVSVDAFSDNNIDHTIVFLI